MKFVRSDEYTKKLFELALFDDKKIIKDAEIHIVRDHNNWKKLKAYCLQSDTYLQFPTNLRYIGGRFNADVVEVIHKDNVEKYFRAVKGSIRTLGSDDVIA